MGFLPLLLLVLSFPLTPTSAQHFTIQNNQTYTPGIAIIDSPLPFTSLGGNYLSLAIDISGAGRLPLPPYPQRSTTATGLFNLTIFLTSYKSNLNLTISNGTLGGWAHWPGYAPEITPSLNECFALNGSVGPSVDDATEGCGDVLLQEPGREVKHINWVWPGCLVDGGGVYNISIHQSFRFNSTQSNYYTIFDLPVNISNNIPQEAQSIALNGSVSNVTRLPCSALDNSLLSQDELAMSLRGLSVQPWLGGAVSTSGMNNGSGSGEQGGSGGGGVLSSAPNSRAKGKSLATISLMLLVTTMIA